MAEKPEAGQELKLILNERGEQVKEPKYMAPPNPTKPEKK